MRENIISVSLGSFFDAAISPILSSVATGLCNAFEFACPVEGVDEIAEGIKAMRPQSQPKLHGGQCGDRNLTLTTLVQGSISDKILIQMNPNLKAIEVKLKNGAEKFHRNGLEEKFSVLDFWSWSTSDLVINITRGIVAEFIVAKALDAKEQVRIEWAPFDITTREEISVEVKSAAYFQSWDQEKLSTIQFNYEKTTPLDEKNGGYRGEVRRVAQVYVFALLSEKEDKSKVDPLNLERWRFYVVPTKSLENRKRSQQSITLHSLEAEKDDLKVQNVGFDELKEAVRKAATLT